MAKRLVGQRRTGSAATGDNLRAEALALVRAQPGYWTMRDLTQHLARRHRLRPGLVRDLLEMAPEFRPTAPPPLPPPRRPAAPVVPRPARTWDRVVEDVTLWLSESDTDCVHVEVAARETEVSETARSEISPDDTAVNDSAGNKPAPGAAQGVSTERLVLRYDFVQAGPKSRLWLTGLAQSHQLLDVYLTANPWTLTPPGRLPLTGSHADVVAPAIVVWRHTTAQAAAVSLREVLGVTLGVDAEQVRVERRQCTPVEHERRLRDDATVRRLSGRTGRTRIGVSQCDRCGQPLSDPVSVKLGIGPECRKYYSIEVIRRLTVPEQAHARPGTLKEKQWLANVTAWMHGATDT